MNTTILAKSQFRIIIFVLVLAFNTTLSTAQRFEVDMIDCNTLIDGEVSQSDYIESGKYYTERKQYGLGLIYTSCAIDLYSDESGGYVARAEVFVQLGQLHLALTDLEMARQLAPDNVEILLRMVGVYDSRNDLEQMLILYNSIIEIEPDNSEHYIGRGYTNELRLDSDAALADYNTAIEINDEAYIAYSYRGFIHAQFGDSDQAFADVNFGIQQNPESDQAYLARADVYYYLEDYDAARKDIERALEINPDDIRILELLIRVYRLLGEPLPEQYRELASQLAFSGGSSSDIEPLNPDEVIQEYNRIIVLNPQSSFAYTFRAAVHFSTDDFENAIADNLYAIELNIHAVQAYLHLAVIYEFDFQDYEQAIAILGKGIENNPENPDLYYYLGAIYEQRTNDDVTTLEYYDKYLEFAGESAEGFQLNHVMEFKQRYNAPGGQ